jgi:outer membrane lipoprotein-sorting protein
MTNKSTRRSVLLICFFATTILAVPIASAQDKPDAKEIIANHIKALGGTDALKAVKSVSSKGVMTMPGPAGELEANMEQYQAGGKFLMVMSIPNMGEIRQGSDGEHFWAQDPQMGTRLLDGEQLAAIKQQYAQPFPALGWADFDGELSVDGEADVDGKKCWKVNFKPKTGAAVMRYFDRDSGDLVKIDMKQSGPAGEMEVEVFSEDVKKVGEIRVPHKQIMSTPFGEMSLEFDEIKLNEKIDDAKFALPEEVKKLVAEKK